MDMNIKGKVALVAASSKGLGKAVAAGLANEGVNLVLCARDEETLRDTADEIREQTGARIITVPTDLTDPDAVEYMIQAATDAYRGRHPGNECRWPAGGPAALFLRRRLAQGIRVEFSQWGTFDSRLYSLHVIP
ncbi:MAG: SDR family NAD(P)-dependent oxidoreductase [Chloroflexi bacterium]|nr:SDR family NAD(P)-dependent oxidoreductase [Chloroflexota bacterium]